MITLVGGAFYKEKETRKKLAAFVARTARFSFDVECKKYESAFARWQGRKEAVFVNSGSSANLALIQALLNSNYLNRGDKVAFSAITWSTNVMPLIQLGLIPVPMDITPSTLNVGSAEVMRVIKKEKIRAVFITNLLGFSHDLAKIKKLCKARNILLLEDNCESLGSVEGKVKLGNFGLASTFSFYVGHHLSTIEGGMICTDDKKLAESLRMVRAHGWDRQLTPQAQKRLRKAYGIDDFYGLYGFYDLGYNLRPNEISGFLGNEQLRYIDETIRKRQKIFIQLVEALNQYPRHYQSVKYSQLSTCSAFVLPVICASLSVKQKLLARARGHVEVRPIVGGNMVKQPFFRKYVKNWKRYSLPHANRAHTHGLYFPIHPDMTQKEVSIIIAILTP